MICEVKLYEDKASMSAIDRKRPILPQLSPDDAPGISKTAEETAMDELIKRMKEKAEDPLLAVFPSVRSLFYEAIGTIERLRQERVSLEKELERQEREDG